MQRERVRENFERPLRRIVRQEDLPELQMGGLVPWMERQRLFRFGYRARGVAQSIVRFRSQQMSLYGKRQAFRSSQCFLKLSACDKLLDDGQRIARHLRE